MNLSVILQSEDLLATLVHDLRQPVGNISLTASYLGLLLESGDARARDQVRVIQEQIERAARMLDEAAVELRRLRVTRESQSEAVILTDSHAPAVA
ncbi:MAG: histidine kinase dimerization/phospho-acceptor domain-containing protein [Bryobacteraceae bacterium]|jgi:signal transduction histidine kinase